MFRIPFLTTLRPTKCIFETISKFASSVTPDSPLLSNCGRNKLFALSLVNDASLRGSGPRGSISNGVRVPPLPRTIDISIYDPIIKPKTVENPSISSTLEKFDPLISFEIQEPLSQEGLVQKEAARLIVIRRRKMRRHKLRKLRKRMRFVWLKEIQKKEYKKEKQFQASQMDRIRQAQSFNAANYVNEFISQVKDVEEVPTWKKRKFFKDVIKISIANDGKNIPPKKP